jgi:hypothetical protein
MEKCLGKIIRLLFELRPTFLYEPFYYTCPGLNVDCKNNTQTRKNQMCPNNNIFNDLE